MIIQPIDHQQQEAVKQRTLDYLSIASEFYQQEFSPIPINFDLKGRSAGMYHVLKQQRGIRYNPFLFAKYFDDNLASTVPHEVAHYVTDILYGFKNIKPHGKEWRNVMATFDTPPLVTAQYDLAGIPVRKQKLYGYHCQCTTHQLTSIRHNKIQRNLASYLCRFCGTAIRRSELIA